MVKIGRQLILAGLMDLEIHRDTELHGQEHFGLLLVMEIVQQILFRIVQMVSIGPMPQQEGLMIMVVHILDMELRGMELVGLL